ncbi:hypothetical protein FB561_1965 [Kribbella amoyensis]|uniref:Uncharacterized protein n=1 Tax=Kribbella amoyensis TaxID=996641 RepID=A0A561BPS2_9ACTN|nr:hypothetical protein FB561_1965 [Kribbella amoyensis]
MLVDRLPTYRRMWTIGACSLAVLGAACALLFVRPTTAALVVVLSFTIATGAQLSIRLAHEDGPGVPAHEIISLSLGAAVAVLGVVGYAMTAGLSTIALLAVVAITSPWVLAYLTGTPVSLTGTPRSAPRSAEQTDEIPDATIRAKIFDPTPPDVGELSDEELCRAWRKSFTALGEAVSAPQREAVVNARLAYLDELERRNPESFARWIESGPRAAGDPGRFMLPHQQPPPG